MIQAISIGLGAFLLFALQPMITKIILPLFGGGSSIWLTALVFFQLTLLLGYGASHLIIKTLRPGYQAGSYIVLLILGLAFIPLEVRYLPLTDAPAIQIFTLLAITLGLPYFVLAMTSPMIQAWIAADSHPISKNPYVLYGVSNLGSLAGLLAYPLLIETRLTNGQQAAFWSYGFGLYAVCMLGCVWAYFKVFRSTKPLAAPMHKPGGGGPQQVVAFRERASWLMQAFVPSAALMVFTQHITVDVVNFPLLWVIPLCLYLISFVVCFFWPQLSQERPARTLAVLLAIGIFVITLRGEFDLNLLYKVIAACLGLFGICMYFHGNLERNKPATRELTSFYLYLSMGGCLGGIFVGILAPLVFKSNFELYLVLIASVYAVLVTYLKVRRRALLRVAQIATVVLIGLIYVNEEIAKHSYIAYKARSFYGTYVIRDFPEIPGQHVAGRILSHGTTTHGGQAHDAKQRLYPISYYHIDAGVGLALRRLSGVKQIGAVGLGTGVVALYGRDGQHFDFFEIDPTVVEIAENRFDNLKAGRASIRNYVGDARIEIRKQPDNHYDLLILDAFTSGSIPTHLITLDAMEEFLRVLKPEGVILYHISNRYVKLLPVLKCIADELNLNIRSHYALGDKYRHKLTAHWVALTPSVKALQQLIHGNPRWKTPGEQKICWKDDFSSLWPVIDFTP